MDVGLAVVAPLNGQTLSQAVGAQGSGAWVAPSSGLLTRVDSTGRVLRHLDPNSGPAAIALGDGAIWLVDTEGDNVTRVDPTGLHIGDTISLP